MPTTMRDRPRLVCIVRVWFAVSPERRLREHLIAHPANIRQRRGMNAVHLGANDFRRRVIVLSRGFDRSSDREMAREIVVN